MDDLKTLAKKVLTRSCPKCGQGKIFLKYLTLKESCNHCEQSFKDLKADDGPAWLTMMLVGHIMVPIMLAYELGQDIPFWISATVWPLSFVALALIVLPFAKAFFVNMIWRGKDKEEKEVNSL